MKKIILLLLSIISSLFIFSTVYASDYILEYDGITEEYTGSIYKLMINDNYVDGYKLKDDSKILVYGQNIENENR